MPSALHQATWYRGFEHATSPTSNRTTDIKSFLFSLFFCEIFFCADLFGLLKLGPIIAHTFKGSPIYWTFFNSPCRHCQLLLSCNMLKYVRHAISSVDYGGEEKGVVELWPRVLLTVRSISTSRLHLQCRISELMGRISWQGALSIIE